MPGSVRRVVRSREGKLNKIDRVSSVEGRINLAESAKCRWEVKIYSAESIHCVTTEESRLRRIDRVSPVEEKTN